MIEGSGSGSPKNIRILRIRIRNTILYGLWRRMTWRRARHNSGTAPTLRSRESTARPPNRSHIMGLTVAALQRIIHEEGKPFCRLRTTVEQIFFRVQYNFLLLCRPSCTLQKQKVVFFLFLCANAFSGYRKIDLDLGLDRRDEKNKKENSWKTKWRDAHDYTLHRYIWTFPSQQLACV